MAYIYLEHKTTPTKTVDPYEPIKFELVMKSKDGIELDNKTDIKITEPGVYVAHWHVPTRFKETKSGDSPKPGEDRNILISLVDGCGNILGRSFTNVDERMNSDSDKYQEYAEIVSGVSIFKVGNKGKVVSLVNHSEDAIQALVENNNTKPCSTVCAGSSFAIYKVDEYDHCPNPCDDDDDDELHACCND